MKKMIKGIALMLTALLLMGTLVGCNSDETKSNGTNNEEKQQTESSQEETKGAVSVAGQDEEVKADSSWYMLNPMADEWTITTVNEFLGFIELISQGSGSLNFEDKVVKLGADLVFNQGDSSSWEIGSESLINIADYQISKPSFDAAFAGVFDGQGHTIEGLYIYHIEEDKEAPDGAALFLYTAHNAVIKNLTIKNSYMEGTRYVGGIVAMIGGTAEVDNVDVQAVLKAHIGEAGGLCGDLSGTVTITSSTFNCDVHSENGVSADGGEEKNGSGGVIGSILYTNTKKQKVLTMKDVIVHGKVNGYQSGGLVGVVRNLSVDVGLNLENVAVANEISGTKQGNLIGGFQDFGDYSSSQITDSISNVYTLDNGLNDVGSDKTLELLNNGASVKKNVDEMKELVKGAK